MSDVDVEALRRQLAATQDETLRGPLERALERAQRRGDLLDLRVGRQRALINAGAALDDAWEDLPLWMGFDLAAVDQVLSPGGAAALRADLTHLAAERLVANAPPNFSTQHSRSVYLEQYPLATPFRHEGPAQTRVELEGWLVVVTRPRRAGEGEPFATERVLSLIAVETDPRHRSRHPGRVLLPYDHHVLVLPTPEGQDSPHRWDVGRWLWDARVPEHEGWGASGVVHPSGALEVRELRHRCSTGQARAGERIGLCVWLQQRGEPLEALELCGVEVSDRLRTTPDQLNARDRRYLHQTLVTCAPWKLTSVLERGPPQGLVFVDRMYLAVTRGKHVRRVARLQLVDTVNDQPFVPRPLWQRPRLEGDPPLPW